MRIDALLTSSHPLKPEGSIATAPSRPADTATTARRVDHCRRMLVELNLPTPFPLAELLAAAARHSGEAIEIKFRRFPPGMPTAFVINLDAITIFCDSDLSPLQQHVSIAHEVAHILFKHAVPQCQPPISPLTSALVEPTPLVPTELASGLLDRFFGELDHPDEAEAIAETFARLVVPMMSFPGAEAMRVNTAHLDATQTRLSLLFDRRPNGCHIRV